MEKVGRALNTALSTTWNLLASVPCWSPWVVGRTAWNTCTTWWHSSGVRGCFACCLLPHLDPGEGHWGSSPLHSGDLVLTLLSFLLLTASSCRSGEEWNGSSSPLELSKWLTFSRLWAFSCRTLWNSESCPPARRAAPCAKGMALILAGWGAPAWPTYLSVALCLFCL